MVLFELFVFGLLGYEPRLFLFLECQKNVGTWVELMISSQKHCQIAENSSNVLVWLRDLSAPSATLNAVFSAVVTSVKQDCTLTGKTK